MIDVGDGVIIGLLLVGLNYSHPDFEFLRELPPAETRSREFEEVFRSRSEALSSAEIAYLQDHQILIVPGFLSDVTTQMKKNFGWMVPEMRKDFDEQYLWLKNNGIKAGRVEIESEASIEENAVRVRAAIERSERPVILMSHSKGGLDILEALREREDLYEKISGWLAIQSPFWGTPVADVWTTSDRSKKIADGILRRLGGSSRSLLGMRVEERVPYMKSHEHEIRQMMQAIPTLIFASWKRDEPGDWDTPFEPFFRDQMARAEIKSDGIIPVNSMLIPGADVIVREGTDHVTTIGAIQLRPFDRVRFLQSLLKLWLQKKRSFSH
jgi:hypothetical protein